MEGHMEDEDEDENINTNEDEIKIKKAKKISKKPEPKIISMPFNGSFQNLWNEWKNYKHDQFNFSYKSAGSEQAALNGLCDLSEGKEQNAIEIIKQSMAQGWKGFFKIKHTENGNQSKQTVREQVQSAFNQQFGFGKRN